MQELSQKSKTQCGFVPKVEHTDRKHFNNLTYACVFYMFLKGFVVSWAFGRLTVATSVSGFVPKLRIPVWIRPKSRTPCMDLFKKSTTPCGFAPIIENLEFVCPALLVAHFENGCGPVARRCCISPLRQTMFGSFVCVRCRGKPTQVCVSPRLWERQKNPRRWTDRLSKRHMVCDGRASDFLGNKKRNRVTSGDAGLAPK